MLSALAARGRTLPAEQVEQLQEKAQKELVVVRQKLEETMSQEKRALRCGLIRKRRELISDMVKRHAIKPNVNTGFILFIWDCVCRLQLRVHKQRRNELSAMSKDLKREMGAARHLRCWQSLLTAHSMELAELINNLDEEAAADIRKVSRFACGTPRASPVEFASHHLSVKGDHACDPECCERREGHSALRGPGPAGTPSTRSSSQRAAGGA